MNWPLERLSSALALRQEPLRLFFRDDDVDEDEATLRRLLQFFLRWKLPLNLAVIPGRLTAAGRELLLQSGDAAPALIELNQHGWLHLNHESGHARVGRKCEFGPSRSYDQQLADIARGQARMTEAFGPHWNPVFIPPWNRCTEDTYRALDRLGFRALSAKQGNNVVTGYRFKELSITLDLFHWRGGANLKPAEAIVDELSVQLTRQATIGVMLHHKVMDERAFALLDAVLDVLAAHPSVGFHTFRSLVELSEAAQQS